MGMISNMRSPRINIMRVAWALALIVGVASLFAEDSAVRQLTGKNFRSDVLQSDQFWLVEFYAPWCGHCKQSAPQFTKAAEILQGVMSLGAVNMDEHRDVGSPYQISGYPTLKFFGTDKTKPIAYESSERTYEKFVEYCIAKMKEEIALRANSEQQL